MFKQFGQAIDKIVDRVTIESKQPIDDSNQIVQFETAYSNGGNDFLPLLYEAILQKVKVAFDYKSFKSTESKRREVSPLLLKELKAKATAPSAVVFIKFLRFSILIQPLFHQQITTHLNLLQENHLEFYQFFEQLLLQILRFLLENSYQSFLFWKQFRHWKPI